MEVGFCLAYRPGETGRVAVGLADLAARLGHGVRFFSTSPPLTTDCRWDRRVTWRYFNTLDAWVGGAGLDVVVFLDPTPAADLTTAKAHKARAVAVAAWDRPWGGDPGVLRAADAVVVTSPATLRLVTDGWGLRNARCVPWAPALAPLAVGPVGGVHDLAAPRRAFLPRHERHQASMHEQRGVALSAGIVVLGDVGAAADVADGPRGPGGGGLRLRGEG